MRDYLRDARLKKGLTLEEAGKVIGRSKQSMSGFELGHVSVKFDDLVALAGAYGVNPKKFLTLESNYVVLKKAKKGA